MSKDVFQEFRDGKLQLGDVVKLLVLKMARRKLTLAEKGFIDDDHMLLLAIWLEMNAIRCLMEKDK